jgi:chromosome segregation and condensation protein ScpB
MNNGQSTLERAFELARSGTCRTIDDIRRQLSKEGFELVHAHVSGGMITKQLKAAMTQRLAAETATMPDAG